MARKKTNGDSPTPPPWERPDHVEEELGDRQALVKAHFIGRDVPESNVTYTEDQGNDKTIFDRVGALPAPYDPGVMVKLFEHSNALRQNVDAYVVNIDGNGHRFEPVIDLESDDAMDQVADAIFLERLIEGDAEADLKGIKEDGDDPTTLDLPSDAEVEARIEEMTHAMRLEKAKLEAFFQFCCVDESFISLRKKTRQDKEVMGNGYWEILRNGEGEPAQFTYVPGFTVRLMPLDKKLVQVVQKVKRAPLSFEEMQVSKRFRGFVQVFEGRKVFYKEFGDPRVMSALTGETYKDEAALEKAESADGKKKVVIATEMLHFGIHSPRSPYGVPRWIGVLLAVLGSRQAEEVNFLYFENKSVPPMAVLVSGGRLAGDSVKKIESFVENRMKGRANFHKILVIEAEGSGGALDPSAANAGRIKIEIVPLTGSQQSDALFQNYDERNMDKVGMAFRLPRLLRGDIRDFNRATAEAALEFAETQVFAPEREDFDWTMNRKVLAELGIRFWTFASNSPTTRNPIDLAEIIAKLVRESILTPEEARELAKGIFNRDFKKIEDMWARIPPELLKAGIIPESEGGTGLAMPPAPAPGAPAAPGEEPPVDPAQEPAPDDVAAQKEAGEKVPGQGKKLERQRLGKRYGDAARKQGLQKLAKDLVDLRAVLLQEEQKEHASKFAKAAVIESERETITIPAAEFASWVADK